MRIGVNTYIWAAAFTEAQLPLVARLREHGFEGIEVPIFDPAVFPAPALRRALADHAMAATAVSAFTPGQSLIDERPEVRRRTRLHVAALIDAAAEAGATLLAGPLYSPVGHLSGRRRTPDEWARAIDEYRELIPVLETHGMSLALEPLNRFETYFLNTAADAVALCAAVGHPRIGVLFDTFHANIEEKDVSASLRAVGSHLVHVHASENDRGTPGRGHVPWTAVFDALAALRYDGWVTIESFGFALGELSAAASIWRDIEASPESIAFDGIRFLAGERTRVGKA
jgi:D-psicose/D-tagatose/L-ribulose 3-epimerase